MREAKEVAKLDIKEVLEVLDSLPINDEDIAKHYNMNEDVSDEVSEAVHYMEDVINEYDEIHGEDAFVIAVGI